MSSCTRLRKVREKTEAAGLALNGCAEVKFKAEQVKNLKEWTEYFGNYISDLEKRLFEPNANQEEILKELEENGLDKHMFEASG